MDNFIGLIVFVQAIRSSLAHKGFKGVTVQVISTRQVRVDHNDGEEVTIFDLTINGQGKITLTEEGCCPRCARIIGDDDMSCPCEDDSDLSWYEYDETYDCQCRACRVGKGICAQDVDDDDDRYEVIQYEVGKRVLGKDRW